MECEVALDNIDLFYMIKLYYTENNYKHRGKFVVFLYRSQWFSAKMYFARKTQIIKRKYTK